ncbi:tRNA epoxyqueuosine(34) reductase QueG [soil metagenome]
MTSLSVKIRQRALEIGFDKVGFASASQLVDEGQRLNDWLGSGYQGEMAWLEREPEKRADPRVLFPGARSVIAVALNYHTPHKHSNDLITGKISRYAWGDDYHDVMREKLRTLLDWITAEVPGFEGKICVDTAPIMDKAWAVRAGLGWLGKHSTVITTELGSWIFLGEIIVNFDLDHTAETVPDHCGTCTKCLDACPTGAIVEPYVVDSRKCISYATIELRTDELPAEIVPDLDGWIYGCDICQDVCPWNRFEQPTSESRFEPRNGETELSLEALAEMDHDAYVERFRKSAIKRTKLTGLKRNAAALASMAGNE